MWTGFCNVEFVVFPSPNDQFQLISDPVDKSVKATVNGAVPVVGPEMKEAEGEGLYTIMTFVFVLLPPPLLAVNVTVYNPELNVWIGFCSLDPIPSPKFQSQLVG